MILAGENRRPWRKFCPTVAVSRAVHEETELHEVFWLGYLTNESVICFVVTG